MFSRISFHVAFLTLCLTLLLASCSPPEAVQALPEASISAQATLPNGFADTLLVNVAKPTALAFSPDGQTPVPSTYF